METVYYILSKKKLDISYNLTSYQTSNLKVMFGYWKMIGDEKNTMKND